MQSTREQFQKSHARTSLIVLADRARVRAVERRVEQAPRRLARARARVRVRARRARRARAEARRVRRRVPRARDRRRVAAAAV